ncbi:MAG: hypothetical protein ACJA0X_001969 [Cyclobacteriaceae bacterium]
MIALNEIAIEEGIEGLTAICTDSTVLKINIHYPTNNSLTWHCIKEAHRLLSHLAAKEGIKTIDYC